MTNVPGQLALRFERPVLPGDVHLPGQLPGQLSLFEDDDDE